MWKIEKLFVRFVIYKYYCYWFTVLMEDFEEDYDRFLEKSQADYKPHQREGVRWMLKRELVRKKILLGNLEYKLPRGGILADEMGLGKTIQLIGLLSIRRIKTLIVVPLSLMDQWKCQIKRFMGILPTVYHGSNKKKLSLGYLKNESFIVLATYNEISGKRMIDGLVQFMSPLHFIKWGRVIFDEAHHLRNKVSLLSMGATALFSKTKWMVTGTPIHNKVSDLLNLYEIIGYKEMSMISLEFLNDYGSLKRTKNDVAMELPELTKEMVWVSWDNEKERVIAEDIHRSFNFCNLDYERELMDEVLEIYARGVFSRLSRARQCCIMPKMLNSSTGLEIEKSSKLDAIEKHITERRTSGSKIVFCHYRREIDELERRFVLAKMTVGKMDGRTDASERKEILKTPKQVLLLQIKTGCEGLNLQDYSEVYFTSPHWNPAIEDQAMARCHRIGQKKKTKVYSFVMQNFDEMGKGISLDQHCMRIQEMKRGLYGII